ncbi:dermonecrotic toxin domain-containing protein [Pseudomonas alkylphenolica]|uniref:dermonecrotic toxin domain-containing protein n=1 Tax=Pseudomonas alkylphenolica TaxID=237609 RepID=UPI000FEC204A|nr:DUF6543 domain-containing protein [Pseudomonas alkylphenolica]
MSITLNVSVPDLRTVVAHQFASRPSLREVLGRAVFKLLATHHPQLISDLPGINTAESFTVVRLADDGTRNTELLVSHVLHSLLQPQPVAFNHQDRLAPGALTDSDSSNLNKLAQIRLDELNGAFDELRGSLFQRFKQAQIEYWNGAEDTLEGVSRSRCLQQMLRAALLQGVRTGGLTEDASICVLDVLQGSVEHLGLFAVEVQVDSYVNSDLLPDLLICAERDEGQLVIWCTPAGKVRCYESYDAFGEALCAETAARYQFESLSWQRFALSGEVFALQVGLLLNAVLDQVDRAQVASLNTVECLEQAFAELSDPARFFPASGFFDNDLPAVKLPDWLARVGSADQFEYHAAVLDLAILQVASAGVTALQDIDDLNSYTARCLRAQMLEDHPVEANYFADDLLLAVSVPVGDPKGVGIETLRDARRLTLTQLAIGHLDALKGGIVTGITHRHEQLIMAWMTPLYVTDLIERVDIGGTYPLYLQEKLNDAASLDWRVTRFGREWRCRLLFDALKAKITGKLSEPAWRTLAAFCRNAELPHEALKIGPLAFKRSPASQHSDEVDCMFVIQIDEPNSWLIYRPLYADDPLCQFNDPHALMAAVSEPGELQLSILQWLDQSVRSIYDEGGFKEPHLSILPLDPFTMPERPAPASLAVRFWESEIDARIFQAQREVMIELADRNSVSNAEHRWAVLKQFGWLMFNLVAPLLPGPLCSATWLLLELGSLHDDLETLRKGSDAEKSLAIADVLSSLAIAMLHVPMPYPALRANRGFWPAVRLDGPPPAYVLAASHVQVSEGQAYVAGALQESAWQHLDFSWLGTQGLDRLTAQQRRRLHALVSPVRIDGLVPLSSGPAQGLYSVNHLYYVRLAGEVYQVLLEEGGARIVGPSGTPGPYINKQEGGWRLDTRLRGGGPRKLKVEQDHKRLVTRLNELSTQTRTAWELSQEKGGQVRSLLLDIKKMKALIKKAQDNEGRKMSEEEVLRLVSLYQGRLQGMDEPLRLARMKAVEAHESLVKHDVEMEAVLATLGEEKYRDRSDPGEALDLRDRHLRLKLDLIRSTDYILSELFQLAGYRETNAMARQIMQLPAEARPEMFRRFRARIVETVGLQDRMLVASGNLDRFLPMVDAQSQLNPGPTARTVQDVIDARQVTTIDLAYQQAMNLADLGLHMDKVSGKKRLITFLDDLDNTALSSAASAHGQLALSNLTAADRITVLRTAWDEYLSALLNSQRIARVGGRLVDAAMLARYTQQMQFLKDAAGSELVQAIREQDLGEMAPSRPPAYPVGESQQRIAHTANGRLVIGTEISIDDKQVLEVRSPYSGKVLHTFHRLNGAWSEESGVSQPELPESEPEEDAKLLAEGLLEHNAQVISDAEALVARDKNADGISSLLDAQIEDVRRVSAGLRKVDEDDQLVGRLNEALEALRASKVRILSDLYSNSQYPSAEGLRYLHAQRLLKIEYVGPRQQTADGGGLDEYRIIRLKSASDTKGRNLWAAHFHFNDVAANATAFDKGHLKLWSQRKWGYREQLMAAQAGETLSIYRGNLTYADVKDIIPFH